jgi:hypothetical protein
VPAMVAEITNSTAGSTETIVFRFEGQFVSCDPPECSNGFTPFDGSTSADLENVTVAKVGNLGCDMADFDDDFTGKIALISRGDCFFYEKAFNAQAAGAIAAIVYNDGADESRFGMVGGTLIAVGELPSIPVVGVSYDDGVALFLADESRVSMKYDTTTVSSNASNFILTTKTGSPDSVLLVDTYRDSLPGSPGVNDALSGPSAVMTLAKAMMETEFEPKHQVVFVIYSGLHTGDQSGLSIWFNSIGIELNIIAEVQCQVLASPNYIRGFEFNSELMLDVISGRFEELGLTYTAEDLLFGNDFPFGFLSSALVLGNKTSEEVMKFGGEVDEPYDSW